MLCKRSRKWKKHVNCLDYTSNVVHTSLISQTRPSQLIRPQAKSYAEVHDEVCYKVDSNAWSCSVAQDRWSEITWMPFNPSILLKCNQKNKTPHGTWKYCSMLLNSSELGREFIALCSDWMYQGLKPVWECSRDTVQPLTPSPPTFISVLEP